MTNLKHYGCKETEILSPGIIHGRVIEFRRDKYTVVTEYGELDAVLKGALVYDATIRAELPCVGDFVLLQYNSSGASPITKVLPRHSKFSRTDFSGHGYAHIKANREQIVAVNFDFVFIVTSLNRDFRINRILRYLTQARASGGKPVVILTKADLCNDCTPNITAVNEAAPDVPVHAISSHTGLGMDALREYLIPGKTIVFLGMSGVGKSSLLNVLMGDDVMRVRETRSEDESKGSHTTTHRQLLMLPCGAMVIDTPGMRELGIFDADESISEGFADVEELFVHCRFKDCSHNNEPDCAIKATLESGILPQARWEQYLAQKRESQYFDDRSAFIRQRSAENKIFSRQYRAEIKVSKRNGGKRK